jgi:transcriptional regulator with XRE-family HTH domain
MMGKLDSTIEKKLNKLVDEGYSQECIDNFLLDVAEGRLSTVPRKSTDDFKIIGARMLEAREIAGLSQIVAANRMGYLNSSRLNKIEKGIDIKSISIAFIKKAALVYSVSVDFLLGLSRDWERNIKIAHGRDITNYLMDTWAKSHMNDVGAINYMQNKISSICKSVTLFFTAITDIRNALTKFRELNPDFDDMRGGASLVSSVDRGEHAIHIVKENLRRYQSDCRAREFTHQLNLFDFE